MTDDFDDKKISIRDIVGGILFYFIWLYLVMISFYCFIFGVFFVLLNYSEWLVLIAASLFISGLWVSFFLLTNLMEKMKLNTDVVLIIKMVLAISFSIIWFFTKIIPIIPKKYIDLALSVLMPFFYHIQLVGDNILGFFK